MSSTDRQTPPTSLRFLAPAKINLHLRVGRRRAADGFHPLLSWMVTVALFDTLELTLTRPTPGDQGPARGPRWQEQAPAAAGDPVATADERHADPSTNRSATARSREVEDRSTGVTAGSPAAPPTTIPGKGNVVESARGQHDARGAAGADGIDAGQAGKPAPQREIFSLTCDLPGLPCDDRNLVVRAANHFAAAIMAGAKGEPFAHAASMSDLRSPVDVDTRGPRRAADAAGPTSDPTGEGSLGALDVVAEQAGQQSGPACVGEAAARDGRRPERDDDRRVSARGERIGTTTARIGPVRATLGKRIPLGAGLGGGSADAARALSGLSLLWAAGWPADDLSAFAASLGSDLPFFFASGGCAVVRGRGEIVHPATPPRVARWAVLILPSIAMPTADVYRRFDEMGLGDDLMLTAEPDWKSWSQLPAQRLLTLLVNDLEAAAFAIEPRLGSLRAGVEAFLGQPVRMSGSGSSLFTLYDSEAQARRRATEVSARFGVRCECVELTPTVADDLGNLIGSRRHIQQPAAS